MLRWALSEDTTLSAESLLEKEEPCLVGQECRRGDDGDFVAAVRAAKLEIINALVFVLGAPRSPCDEEGPEEKMLHGGTQRPRQVVSQSDDPPLALRMTRALLKYYQSSNVLETAYGRDKVSESSRKPKNNNSRMRVIFKVRLRDSLVPHCRVQYPAEVEGKNGSEDEATSCTMVKAIDVTVPLSLIEPLAAARLSEGGKVYAESTAAPSVGTDAAFGPKGELGKIRDRLTRYGKLRALLVGDIVGTCCSALADGLDVIYRNHTRIDSDDTKNDGEGKERLKSESDDCDDVGVPASSVEPKKANYNKKQTPGSVLLMRNALVGLCQALFVLVTTANLARVAGSDRQPQRPTLFDLPFLHDVLIARLATEVSTGTFLYPNEGLAKLLLIDDNNDHSLSAAAICDNNNNNTGGTACGDNDDGDIRSLLSDFSIPSASAIGHRFARPWLWCPVAVATVVDKGKNDDGNTAKGNTEANGLIRAHSEAPQCKEDALPLLENAPQTTRPQEEKASYANTDSNVSMAENQLMSADARGTVMPQQQKTRKLLSLKSLINTAVNPPSEANETSGGEITSNYSNSTYTQGETAASPIKSKTNPEEASDEIRSNNIVPRFTSTIRTTNSTLYPYVSADAFRHYMSMLLITAADKGLRSFHAASARQERSSMGGPVVDSTIFACVEDLVDAVVCRVRSARRDLDLSSSRNTTGPKIDCCWGRAVLTFVMKRYAQRVLFDPAPATPPTDAAVVTELVAACGIDADYYKRGAIKGKVDAVKSLPDVAVLCHSIDWKAPASISRDEDVRTAAAGAPLAAVSTEVCLKTKVHANEAEQRAYAAYMDSVQKEATRDVVRAGMKGRAKSDRKQPSKKKQAQRIVGKSAGRKRPRVAESNVTGEDVGGDDLGDMSSELSSSSSSSDSSSDSEGYDSEEEAFIAKNTSKIEARVKTLIGARERRLIDVQVVFMGPRVDTNTKEGGRSQWLEQDDDESLPMKGSKHNNEKDNAASNSSAFPSLVVGASTGPFDNLTNEELYRGGLGTQYKCFVFRHITYRSAARHPQRGGGGAPLSSSSAVLGGTQAQQPPPTPATYISSDACYVVGCYDINPRHLQPLQCWHTVRGGGGGLAPASGSSGNATPHAYDYHELRPVSASAWLAEGGCVPPQVASRILGVANDRSNNNNNCDSGYLASSHSTKKNPLSSSFFTPSAVLDEGCCMYEYKAALSVDPLLVVPDGPSPFHLTPRGEHGRTDVGLFRTLDAVGEAVTTEVFYALVLPVGAEIVAEKMKVSGGGDEGSGLAVRSPAGGAAEYEQLRSPRTILFDPNVVAERLPQPVPLPAAAKPPRWPVPFSALSSQYDHTLPYSVLFCAEGRKSASSMTVIRHVVRVFEVDKDLVYGPKRLGQGSDEEKESDADGEGYGSSDDEDNAEEGSNSAALRGGQRIRRPSRAPSTASSFSSHATDYVKPQFPFLGSFVPVATLSRMCTALRRTLAKSAYSWAPVGPTSLRGPSHNPQSALFRHTQLVDKADEDYSSRLMHALALTMQRVSNAATRVAILQATTAAGSARPIPVLLPPPMSVRIKSLETRGTAANREKGENGNEKDHQVVGSVFNFLFGPPPPLSSPSGFSSSHHCSSTFSAAPVPTKTFLRIAVKAFADTLCYCTVCSELPPALAERVSVKKEEDQPPTDKSESVDSSGVKRSVLKLGSRFVNLKETTESAAARSKRRARSVKKVDPNMLCGLLDRALRELTTGFEGRCQKGEDHDECGAGADDPKRTLVLSLHQLRDMGAQLELAGSTRALRSGQAGGVQSRTASLPVREVAVRWIHSVFLSLSSLTD